MFNILQQPLGPAWAIALARAQTELTQLQPINPTKLAAVAAWLLVEHVFHDLWLDGIKLSRERVAELIIHQAAPQGPEERLAVNYAQAVQWLHKLVTDETSRPESPVELTPERLCHLHSLAVGQTDQAAGRFRAQPINPLYTGHEPAQPEELPRLIELTLEWFAADSMSELHPVEQAALVHLRLYELQPFGKASGRLTRLAASLFTVRRALPPIIISRERADAYYQALLTGFQMATQPLVELLAQSLGQTLRQMCAIIKNDDT
ncbi:MAG: Fic family protein [Acidobacteriota bacterium]|nr:Fic family protein [Blastocatellia bacterium]MDW8241204.1 Fic family protein [Acidobacteriota bacterium]